MIYPAPFIIRQTAYSAGLYKLSPISVSLRFLHNQILRKFIWSVMMQKSDNSLKRNATYNFCGSDQNLEYNAPTVLILRQELKHYTTVVYVALTL